MAVLRHCMSSTWPRTARDNQKVQTRGLRHSFIVAAAILSFACDGGPTAPTPAGSTLTYHVDAASLHGEASGSFTTADASFSGSVRTTCVPNPNIAGSVCPDLMVLVRPSTGSQCQLWVFAPGGEPLTARTYPNAQRMPKTGVAGLEFQLRQGRHHVQLVGRELHDP